MAPVYEGKVAFLDRVFSSCSGTSQSQPPTGVGGGAEGGRGRGEKCIDDHRFDSNPPPPIIEECCSERLLSKKVGGGCRRRFRSIALCVFKTKPGDNCFKIEIFRAARPPGLSPRPLSPMSFQTLMVETIAAVSCKWTVLDRSLAAKSLLSVPG